MELSIRNVLETPCEFTEYIPPKGKRAIVDFLSLNATKVPLEYIFLVYYTKVAQIMSLKRTKITSKIHMKMGYDGFFVNMYTMLFLNSGSGKDMTNSAIENQLMKNAREDFMKIYNQRRQVWENSLPQKAEDMYKLDGKNKKRKNLFVAQNESHTFQFELSRGTPQGVYSFRKTLKDVGIGSLTFHSSEFANYYLSRDENNEQFLHIMIDGYYGNTKAGVLKTEKNTVEIKDIPMNMLVYTANLDFIGEPENRGRLYSFFGDGFARRAFIYVGTPKKLDEEQSVDDYIKQLNVVNNASNPLIGEISSHVNALFDAISSIVSPVYELSEDADRKLAEYILYLRPQSNKPKPKHLAGEIEGRWERAMKLSCLLSAYEEPRNHVVSGEYMERAIAITEFYGKSFIKYFTEQDKDEEEKLYDFLKANIGKPVSKTQIKDQKIHGNKNFAKWIDEIIPNLQVRVAGYGESIESKPTSNNGGRNYILRNAEMMEEEVLDAEKVVASHVETELNKTRT